MSGGSPDYGYTGKWQRQFDQTTQTIQMGARQYDPALGRFTSADPLMGTNLDPQQRNRYSYTSNNPLVRYDLTGYAWCGPGVLEQLKDAGGWIGDKASDWYEGVQVGLNNPAALWDATQQFGYDFFAHDFVILFSADSSLADRFGALGMIALNFAPGGKLGEAGKLGKLAKLADEISDTRRLINKSRSVLEAGISASDARRIQNAANRTKQKITVIGSRASGKSKATSDWDYILSGKSKQRHSARSSLPRGNQGGEIDATGRETGIDIFQDFNNQAPGYTELDVNRPHVIFYPE